MPAPKTDNPLVKSVYYFCMLWMVVAVGAIAMVITVWVMIIIQDLDVFQNTMGTYIGNDVLKYPPSDPNNGYVDNTNIPKHLGGAVFSTAFAIAMIIFCLFALAGDIYWKFPYAHKWLVWTCMLGIQTTNDLPKYNQVFLWANALLKLFVSVALGSRSWSGLDPNNTEVNTPTFALYACFIMLGSILPTLLVFVDHIGSSIVTRHLVVLYSWIVLSTLILDIKRGQHEDAEKAKAKKAAAKAAAAEAGK